MGCLGVLFAIDKAESAALKECNDDEALVECVQETVEERWDEEWLCQTDKSWDAMHRCFAEGKLELFGGEAPLNSVIFGGEILNTSSDYYVSLKNNEVVKNIAAKIGAIGKDKLKQLYSKIGKNYQGEKDNEDFEYTWEYFEEVRQFYLKVALTDKDVIFTVDQ